MEGIEWDEDVFVFFRTGVRGPFSAFVDFLTGVPGPCSALVDFLFFPPTPFAFCFDFLVFRAVDIFSSTDFFFFFVTFPESGMVEVVFFVACFMFGLIVGWIENRQEMSPVLCVRQWNKTR